MIKHYALAYVEGYFDAMPFGSRQMECYECRQLDKQGKHPSCRVLDGKAELNECPALLKHNLKGEAS